jgi:Domain of unknown function (DUF4326)
MSERTPALPEMAQSSRGEAEARADSIRAGLVAISEQLEDLSETIGRAYRGRDWAALGYSSWDGYATAEFGADRMRLPREKRQEVTAALRAELLSTRAIAGVLGIDDRTVRRDLSGAAYVAPERVAGIDGKAYSTSRATPQEPEPEIFEAELVEEEEPAAPEDPWSDEEQALAKRLQGGATVVVSLRGQHDRLIRWATECDAFVRIDRRTEWGNRFEIPDDGDRFTVIENYARHYLPHKPSLLRRIESLHGKALGCWCAPEPCHGDVLADIISGESQHTEIYAAFRELEPGEC